MATRATSTACGPKNIVPALELHWTLEEPLGSGSQGEVWVVRSKLNTKRTMAVKLLRCCGDAQREVEAYEQLRKFSSHENVLDVRFGLSDGLCINLGFDLCKIDLLEHVLSGTHVTESTARRWSRQLIAAIGHVHACNVAHLDVKLENMFLDHRGVLKLGDMGLAAVLAPGERTQKMCGSGVYAAPEVLLSSSAGPYDGRSADIWSVGVSMFVMVRGRFPFQLKHTTQLYTAFVESQKIAAASGSLPMPAPMVLSSRSQREGFSVSLLRMLDAALALDPADRPTAEHLAAAPWLREHDELLGDRTDDNTACVAREATPPASVDGDTQAFPKPGEGYTTPEVSPTVVQRKIASSVAGETISTRLNELQVASSKPTTTLKVMAPWNSNAAESSPGGMRRERKPEQRVMPYKRAKGASALSIRTKC